jgi:hypothetical protein
MSKLVPCHWTNREPIGSPPKFTVTGWREADRKAKPTEPERRSGRGAVQGSLL